MSSLLERRGGASRKTMLLTGKWLESWVMMFAWSDATLFVVRLCLCLVVRASLVSVPMMTMSF